MNLSGKDYFTLAEAAHYCCVSTRTFERWRDEHNIVGRRFMGNRLIYRRIDLQRAIEAQWQPSASNKASGYLTTVKAGSVSARRSDLLPSSQNVMRNEYSRKLADSFLQHITPSPRARATP